MIKEKTIDNEAGDLGAEVLVVMNDDRLPAREDMEVIEFLNDRFQGKMNIVHSFMYCQDRDFKRIYLN